MWYGNDAKMYCDVIPLLEIVWKTKLKASRPQRGIIAEIVDPYIKLIVRSRDVNDTQVDRSLRMFRE